MADLEVVTWKPTPPLKPVNFDIKVHKDNSLEMRWEGTPGASYQLEIRYFELGGVMIKPKHSENMEVKDPAAHVLHPESLSKASGWVVKVELRTKSKEDGSLSDPITKQVSWDGELSKEEAEKDLKEKLAVLEKKELANFYRAKGNPRFLLLGGQHHGKSSLANHLHRIFACDLTLKDEMDVAPAGTEEKTVATKSLEVPLSGCKVSLIDTPAFATMDKEAAGKLQTLLSTGLQDGKRRDKLAPDERSYFRKPPHGAVVVMSLCHWRDQTDEMQSYLQKMAETFKEASGGTVAFPYVVACTHRDIFLQDCQKEDPAKELQKALDGIKKAALTDHVYSITCYKKDGAASSCSNEATFDLVGQILTKAKNENTAPVQENNRNRFKHSIMVLSAALVTAAVAVARDAPVSA